MNIFYVDKDPYKAASFLYDSHVVKMILESAQMLSTCQWWYRWRYKYKLDFLYKGKSNLINSFIDFIRTQYKQETGLLLPTHVNHPLNCWCRQSEGNYDWLYDHFLGLLEQYKLRYNKTHKYKSLKNILSNNPMRKIYE
jgi:hypothetical protein